MSDDDQGDDYGFSLAEANYSPNKWNPAETSVLLVAGREVLLPPDREIKLGEMKATVPSVEALGNELTFVLSGDTSSTGGDDENRRYGSVAVGVVVSASLANDRQPTTTSAMSAHQALASFKKQDHAAIAETLPPSLRAPYLAADDKLLLVPVGALSWGTLVYGVAGAEDDEDMQGEFHIGTDMAQNPHEYGVWGEAVGSSEDIAPVEITNDDTGTEKYWLVSRYD